MAHPVNTALARKLTAGQEEQGDKPRSVLRALRLATARAAGDRFQLPLSVIGAKQSARSADTLDGFAGDDWLLLQFANAEGVCASVCLDIGAVSAIVQVQTIGEVLPGDPSLRGFTDTDAAMVAPLVEEVLARAVRLVEVSADQTSLSGFEFRTRLADMRTLSLAMVEDRYTAYDLTVELGGGLRQGQMSFLLPDRPDSQGDGDVAEDDAGPKLHQASGVLRAELDAVICRMSLPLSSLAGLSAGDVVPLTGSRLDRTEVLTIDRSRVAIGRLGQCGGMRAIRLNEYTPPTALTHPENHEFLEARPTPLNPVEGAEAQGANDLVPISPDGFADLEGDLEFNDSDQIAAEISKLAGLTDGPEPIG